MNSNISIQKLSASRKYVLLENNLKVELPSWIKNRFSSLRFISDTKTLQIQCYKCKEWFDVAIMNDNVWSDIHKDTDIKLHGSGFSSYCSSCSLQLESQKVNPTASPYDNAETNSENQPVSSMEKDTIFLTHDNLRYVKLRLALSDMRKADFYNYLIAKEMEVNPISKFL